MFFRTIRLARLVGLVERLQVRKLLVDRCDIMLDDVGELRDFDGSVVEEVLRRASWASRCSLAVVEAMSLLMAWARRANSPLGDAPGPLVFRSFCFAGWADFEPIDSTRPWNSDVRSLIEWP